ncbi:unnamed protein product [Didymodactylos carnosus]|uniref:Chloride channel protein n=1 Tax=Didymodactylos carnosus TaxID=1234261 RepID=A0A814DG62_9BILA|nr:unnamed protein product [Didymodactylos carnosus]CAF0953714.1 unnamed protein product [Didymodactylos carnosus]CAF3661919.1 unnamed protein product [Didymodactylos carnosus]CAF3729073.1 unnamed protein product [Didymodactylos carnosus]
MFVTGEHPFLPVNPFAQPIIHSTTTSPTSNNSHYPQDEDMVDITNDITINKHNGTSETNKPNGLMSGVDIISTHYDDFQTIDWLKDLMRDRFRHRMLRSKRRESFLRKLLMYHDAWSGWLCVLLVGLSAGVIAAVIDIGTNWIIHLRNGICLNAFWLNREQCCWASKKLNYDRFNTEECGEWFTWPQVFGDYRTGAFEYILSYFMFILWSVIFATFAVLLVKVFAPYACGSGIPEIKTILGGFIIRGYLGKWTLLIKSIGMMCATSAGLILGKEGPFVHIACCCGNIFSYLFPKYGRNEAKKREILSAAAAAGVSVAFGAPIGGVLFSLEEISYYFPYKTLWRSFFCAMVGALVVRSINPYGNGHDIQFSIDYSVPWASFELIPFILLGILGGLWGAFFIKTNVWWCRFRKNTRLGQYTITEVVCLALVTAIICYPNPYTRMSMPELIKRLVSQCKVEDSIDLCDYSREPISSAKIKVPAALAGEGVHRAMWELFFALIVQILLVTFTIGVKVPAGLIIPSMSIGAITGRIIGVITEQLALQNPNFILFKHECNKADENCVTPGLYAIVGACAFLGGVSKMTVSLVVIMFELTGGLTYIVPLMAAAMTAKWIGDGFIRGGIYDAHIELNGYPFLDNKEEFNFTTTANDVMRPRPEQSSSLAYLTQNGMTFSEVDSILKHTTHTSYPVVVSKDQPYIVGQIQRRDLQILLKSQKTQHFIASSYYIQFTAPSDSSTSPNLDSDLQDEQRLTTSQPEIIRVGNLLDQAPIIITDQTPMETVIDMFRKLGLRQAFITHNGRLRGIITKKDVLRHMQQMASHSPDAFYDT